MQTDLMLARSPIMYPPDRSAVLALSRLHLSDYFSLAPMLEERCGELAIARSFSPATFVFPVLAAGEPRGQAAGP